MNVWWEFDHHWLLGCMGRVEKRWSLSGFQVPHHQNSHHRLKMLQLVQKNQIWTFWQEGWKYKMGKVIVLFILNNDMQEFLRVHKSHLHNIPTQTDGLQYLRYTCVHKQGPLCAKRVDSVPNLSFLLLFEPHFISVRVVFECHYDGFSCGDSFVFWKLVQQWLGE